MSFLFFSLPFFLLTTGTLRATGVFHGCNLFRLYKLFCVVAGGFPILPAVSKRIALLFAAPPSIMEQRVARPRSTGSIACTSRRCVAVKELATAFTLVDGRLPVAERTNLRRSPALPLEQWLQLQNMVVGSLESAKGLLLLALPAPCCQSASSRACCIVALQGPQPWHNRSFITSKKTARHQHCKKKRREKREEKKEKRREEALSPCCIHGSTSGSCQVQQCSLFNIILVCGNPLRPLSSTSISVNWCSNARGNLANKVESGFTCFSAFFFPLSRFCNW